MPGTWTGVRARDSTRGGTSTLRKKSAAAAVANTPGRARTAAATPLTTPSIPLAISLRTTFSDSTQGRDRTPNGARASSMALASAAGGEIAPPSPTPFSPSGLRGDGHSRWMVPHALTVTRALTRRPA